MPVRTARSRFRVGRGVPPVSASAHDRGRRRRAICTGFATPRLQNPSHRLWRRMSPRRGLKVCATPGCPDFAAPKRSYCAPCERRYDATRRQATDAARPSPAERGYGTAWRDRRARFLAANPVCADCGGAATVADHAPVTRAELVRRGDPDPDAAHHLQPRCASCHGRKTVRDDGGWGRPPSGAR